MIASDGTVHSGTKNNRISIHSIKNKYQSHSDILFSKILENSPENIQNSHIAELKHSYNAGTILNQLNHTINNFSNTIAITYFPKTND